MSGRSAKIWLMTIVLAVVPLRAIVLLLYRAGRFAVRKCYSAATPYDEWLALRNLVVSRRRKSTAERPREPGPQVRAARPEEVEHR